MRGCVDKDGVVQVQAAFGGVVLGKAGCVGKGGFLQGCECKRRFMRGCAGKGGIVRIQVAFSGVVRVKAHLCG